MCFLQGPRNQHLTTPKQAAGACDSRVDDCTWEVAFYWQLKSVWVPGISFANCGRNIGLWILAKWVEAQSKMLGGVIPGTELKGDQERPARGERCCLSQGSCTAIPQYMWGIISRTPKFVNAQVPYIKGVVFTYNPYVHIGYRRVCLHMTSFMWIQSRDGQCGKFKFCFSGTFWDYFPSIFSVWGWLNLQMRNTLIRKLTICPSQSSITSNLLSFSSIPINSVQKQVGHGQDVGVWLKFEFGEQRYRL